MQAVIFLMSQTQRFQSNKLLFYQQYMEKLSVNCLPTFKCFSSFQALVGTCMWWMRKPSFREQCSTATV